MLNVGNSKRTSTGVQIELSADDWKKKLTKNQENIARQKFKQALDLLKLNVGIDVYNLELINALKIQCCKSVLAGEF